MGSCSTYVEPYSFIYHLLFTYLFNDLTAQHDGGRTRGITRQESTTIRMLLRDLPTQGELFPY